MPDLTGAPPTIGSSKGNNGGGKIQTSRGGRGRFNPSGRGSGGGRGGSRGGGGGGGRRPDNPQHPGHIPGSLASRPLNGIFAIDKPSGPTSMSLLEDLKMLFAFSPLFRNPDGSIPSGHGGKAWRPSEPWCKKYKHTSAPPKVGQGGTLDPLASGVLVVGIGSGTKELQGYLDCAKSYTSVGLLGASTTSYDVMDPIMNRVNHSHVTSDLIQSLLPYFTGPLLQYPPLFSAVKMEGKRLLDYARQNLPLPRPIEAREIEVTHLELVDFLTPDQHAFKAPEKEIPQEDKKLLGRVKQMAGQDATAGDTVVKDQGKLESEREKHRLDAENAEQAAAKTGEPQAAAEDAPSSAEEAQTIATAPAPKPFTESSVSPSAFRLRMTVSSGTYVRSIVHDVGLACESAAHVVELRRTRQGEWFTSDDVQQQVETAAGATNGDGSRAGEIEVVDGLAEAENEATTAAETTPAEEATLAEEGAPTAAHQGNVLPWDLFADALAELKESKDPNKMKVDGEDRELKEWEKRLLAALRPV